MIAKAASATFVVKVLVLSVLCVALHEARADVQGIPQNVNFPLARYPFARVPTTCASWRLPAGSEARWGAVDFSGACRDHELCYQTEGASWAGCNERYLQDMRTACDRDLRAERLSRGQAGGADHQALPLCYQISDLLFGKVQQAEAVRRFAEAQKLTRDYQKYLSSLIDRIYVERLGRPARGDERQDAHVALKEGYNLQEIQDAIASRTPRGSIRARLAEIDEAEYLLAARGLQKTLDERLGDEIGSP